MFLFWSAKKRKIQVFILKILIPPQQTRKGVNKNSPASKRGGVIKSFSGGRTWGSTFKRGGTPPPFPPPCPCVVKHDEYAPHDARIKEKNVTNQWKTAQEACYFCSSSTRYTYIFFAIFIPLYINTIFLFPGSSSTSEFLLASVNGSAFLGCDIPMEDVQWRLNGKAVPKDRYVHVGNSNIPVYFFKKVNFHMGNFIYLQIRLPPGG